MWRTHCQIKRQCYVLRGKKLLFVASYEIAASLIDAIFFYIDQRKSQSNNYLPSFYMGGSQGLWTSFFILGKQIYHTHTSMSSTKGKTWNFRAFCTSYRRGLCPGLAAQEPGCGAVAVGGSAVPATGELLSWAGIAAAWRRRDVPSLWVLCSCCCFVNNPSKFELSHCCCLVQGLLTGGEMDPLVSLWINLFISLPE